MPLTITQLSGNLKSDKDVFGRSVLLILDVGSLLYY